MFNPITASGDKNWEIDFREWALSCSLSFVRLPFIVYYLYTAEPPLRGVAFFVH